MKATTDHCTIRNEDLFCMNCGGSQKIPYPIAIDMYSAMTKQFIKSHKSCEKSWKEPEADQSLSINQKAYFWLKNGEKGLSSTCMFNVFESRKPVINGDHPLDPDDFSRCYKLLKTIPEWRPRITEMKACSQAWSNLADHWDELEKMYEAKDKKMYDFMQKLYQK
jgi:hypothetical protein